MIGDECGSRGAAPDPARGFAPGPHQGQRPLDPVRLHAPPADPAGRACCWPAAALTRGCTCARPPSAARARRRTPKPSRCWSPRPKPATCRSTWRGSARCRPPPPSPSSPWSTARCIEVRFKEGQDVHAGDVLARIDPRTYQAALDQAVAKKKQDEATLANARLDVGRYAKLAATAYASAQQYDTARSTGGAAGGAGAVRPGADRQRPHPALLHHHHLADRRPRRLPPGRCRQHRARRRRHRAGRAHHPAADPGAVHPAAAKPPRRRRRHGRGRAGRAGPAAGRRRRPGRTGARPRHADRAGQPGGHRPPAPSACAPASPTTA